MSPRARPRVVAVVLVVVAIVLVVAEPFPKGETLLTFIHDHGVDTGDLPAIALLLVAARLVIE